MSNGCRVTNTLDISVHFSRCTGIYVFWNALPAAGYEHRLSQTVHCRSPDMTIAGFFRFVLITEFTPFLQDLCFISHDGFDLGFSLVPEGRPLPYFSLRDGATIKWPPPKTPSQSSQPSRNGISGTDRSVFGCLHWVASPHWNVVCLGYIVRNLILFFDNVICCISPQKCNVLCCIYWCASQFDCKSGKLVLFLRASFLSGRR